MQNSQVRGQECAVKEQRKLSGYHGNHGPFRQEKVANTRGEWQVRNSFSRNFFPGDAIVKPHSSALQNLGDKFSTQAAMVTGFPCNVAGWNRACGKLFI